VETESELLDDDSGPYHGSALWAAAKLRKRRPFVASTKKGTRERDQTDESLTRERVKTDAELLRRDEADEEIADAVVEKARQRADDVLALARCTEDEKLRASGATSEAWASLRAERHQADDTLRDERSVANEVLANERERRRRALTALLALERSLTDDHLARERDVADVAIDSRDDFLAMASHDLRNMIGGIAMSAASLVNIRCAEDVHDAILRDAQRIQRYAARMARLVGDLVDVVSIDAGRLAVMPERHDASDLVRETLEVFEPIAAAKRISIAPQVEQGSLLARCDHERILQVLANLVGNAVKFAPEGGRIDIVVEPLERQVRFAVADTGPGIAPDKLRVIFDRFWQVTDKTTRSGLGLGLYISKCIVEAHGGKIWPESRVGEGTTVYFTLPAAEATS
jgi:signal transduction histidine kinase